MSGNVQLGDGVLDAAKENINIRLNQLLKQGIDIAFDYFGNKVKDFPETIERLLLQPETTQEIADLWSKRLFEEGVVPEGYNGLPDNLLISNFHQDGYLAGMYVGYVLAMMALVDNDASKDLILSVRDYIRPNLIGHHYDDRDEFIDRYEGDKYKWIDKEPSV